MRIAKRPAERDVDRAVTNERGAVVASARNAELRWNLIVVGKLHNFFDECARYDIRIVHSADNEAIADLGVAKPFRFERRIGADESVDGEDEIGCAALRCQAFGQRACTHQAKLFACGENERYIAVLHWIAQGPERRDQRGVSHTVVETAAIGSRAKQRPVRFRNGDRIADANPELLYFFRSSRTYVHAIRLRAGIGGPLKFRRVPIFRKLHHRFAVSAAGVNESRVSGKIALNSSAFPHHFKAPIGADGFHFEADFVHVCDDEQARRLRSGRRNSNAHDQISGGVGFSCCPSGKQRPNHLSNPLFMIAHAVGFR